MKENMEDVLKMMNGEENLSELVNEVKDFINKKTQEKFMDKIQQILRDYKNAALEEADSELKLLNAIKPFMNDKEQQKQFEAMTDMFGNIRALDKLMKEVNINKKEESDLKAQSVPSEDSIVDDGTSVYEVDEMCEKDEVSSADFTNQGFPLMLLLLMLFGFEN